MIIDEPLRIAICDDMEDDAEKLSAMLKECKTPAVCEIFSSGEALLEAYRPQKYDLLLTDIYMGGMSGVDAVAKIREIDEDIPVAFITTSTEFTLQSYRLSALKYIEKPVQLRDLEDILNLAMLKRDNAPHLLLHKNGREYAIPFYQILYLEQQNHLLHIYLKNGSSEQFYEKLSAVLPQLEEQGFFSPHKSFAVNLAFVRDIDTDYRCFIMVNDKNIPIRRESMGKAKKALEAYLFRKTRGCPV